jgi:hypothetical protein
MDGYTELKFVKFVSKKSNVQFDCFHNVAPKQEFYIELITKEVALRSNASSVVSNVSRVVADLNRKVCKDNFEAVFEYRKVLEENLIRNGYLERPYLLVIFHGMRNRGYKDIEIGTRGGTLATPEITKWFVEKVKEKFALQKVAVDDEFCGSPILKHYRYGNEYFDGFGENLNIFQVELSGDLRWSSQDLIVKNFSEIAAEFEKEIVCEKAAKKVLLD